MSAFLALMGHLTDLGGGLVVRRMLPAAQRQAVGPFIFFDHFGPVVQLPDANSDVRPHPHIGLATVTYLFEGAMMHRDSLGTVQRIEPGAVNLMIAGRGIVHSERTPDDLKHAVRRLHGLQLWVALPQASEECAPSFAHTCAEDIPEVSAAGVRVRVLIGSACGVTSPVQTPMPTLYVDITLEAGAEFELTRWADEMALYATDNAVEFNGEALPAHTMAVLSGVGRLANRSGAAARLVVIGGAPLDGHRFIWWNFVSSNRDRIARAASDWQAGLFDSVPGESERIELPARKFD
jgi:redox-sensitive bicupin YhaK (pirin superfamily)